MNRFLFLSDIYPTAYMAAENCQIEPGDTVAIWGCGPVGQLAIRSAFLIGAERVIAIDHIESRLRMAEAGGAETIDFSQDDVFETIREKTGGRGADSCLDAVGLEAQGHTLGAVYDRVRAALWLTTDRITTVRQAIQACRKGGTVSIPGVYGGLPDKFPLGAAFSKGLTLKMGQTHVQRYLKPLMDTIQQGKIDTRFIISHRLGLEDAAEGYRMFHSHQGDCTKVVLSP